LHSSSGLLGASVTNSSNQLQWFGVTVGTETEPSQWFYHMNNLDICIWARFHHKTRPLQAEIFRSKWGFEFWLYHDLINT
jgi:hypothetical protein